MRFGGVGDVGGAGEAVVVGVVGEGTVVGVVGEGTVGEAVVVGVVGEGTVGDGGGFRSSLFTQAGRFGRPFS